MNKKNKFVICGFVLCMVFVFSMMININEIAVKTNVNINNEKIEWGIKRNNNNMQPDIGKLNKELIEKYNGIALGNNEEKNIYLTFDLGYEAGYTEKILDALKENNVQGTFFITAHYANTASDIVKRMIDEGHIIGNHTVNHKSMPSLSDEELKKEVMDLHQVIYEKFGYEMKYIRPPKGEFSERTLSLSEQLGYKTVMWSFAYVDWDEKKQPSCEEGIKKITENLHNGEVMLLHATSKTNADIMDHVIKKTREMGYEFKSLDDFKS